MYQRLKNIFLQACFKNRNYYEDPLKSPSLTFLADLEKQVKQLAVSMNTRSTVLRPHTNRYKSRTFLKRATEMAVVIALLAFLFCLPDGVSEFYGVQFL